MSPVPRSAAGDPTRFTLAQGADLLGTPPEQLWWRYLGLGGRLDFATFVAVLDGRPAPSTHEAEVTALTLNEAFHDLGIRTYPVGHGRSVALPRRVPQHRVPRDVDARRVLAMARARQLTEQSVALVSASALLIGASWSGRRASGESHPTGLHPTAM